MTTKDKILDTLSNKWKSTNKIKEESGVNWYRVDRELHELLSNGKVEMQDMPDTTYWRIKKTEVKQNG